LFTQRHKHKKCLNLKEKNGIDDGKNEKQDGNNEETIASNGSFGTGLALESGELGVLVTEKDENAIDGHDNENPRAHFTGRVLEPVADLTPLVGDEPVVVELG
jgi:hypothetical protein